MGSGIVEDDHPSTRPAQPPQSPSPGSDDGDDDDECDRLNAAETHLAALHIQNFLAATSPSNEQHQHLDEAY